MPLTLSSLLEDLCLGIAQDFKGLDVGGAKATAYAEAVSVYLTFSQSRVADYGCTLGDRMPFDVMPHQQVIDLRRKKRPPLSSACGMHPASSPNRRPSARRSAPST